MNKPGSELQVSSPEEQDLLTLEDALEGIDTTMGHEEVDPMEDLVSSRIAIIQGGSPQVKKQNPLYIEGAEIGDIVDTARELLFKEGMVFFPIGYRKRFNEWTPQDAEREPDAWQGLICSHPDSSILDECPAGARSKFKLRVLPNGNHIVETAYFFGWVAGADGFGDLHFAYLVMLRTQLKKSKIWLTLTTEERILRRDKDTGSLKKTRAPMCWRGYLLTSRYESNDHGDWMGWHVKRSPVTLQDYCKEHSIPLKELMQAANVINAELDNHPVLNVDHRGDVTSAGEIVTQVDEDLGDEEAM